nr:hypothetical protein [uncultured Sphingomonas sp.]
MRRSVLVLDNGPEDLDRAIHDAAARLNGERQRNPVGGPRSAA